MLTVQHDPTDCTSKIMISFSNLITWSLMLCVCVCFIECGPSEASARVSCGEGGAVGAHVQL